MGNEDPGSLRRGRRVLRRRLLWDAFAVVLFAALAVVFAATTWLWIACAAAAALELLILLFFVSLSRRFPRDD